MSTHTPGPWQATADGYVSKASSEEGYVRYTSPWCDGAWDGDAEAIANGTLMAAAPDLLEALVELTTADDDILKCDDPTGKSIIERKVKAITKARAAIAKARGEKT